jgi:hypothetical protein
MGVAPKEKASKLAPSTAAGDEARSSGSISAFSSAPSARSNAGHRTCSASFRNLRTAATVGYRGAIRVCSSTALSRRCTGMQRFHEHLLETDNM